MRVGNKEPCLNHHLSADWSLQLETMKSESLVIVDQHATVNLYLSLVHTARHTLKVNCTQKNVFDQILAASFFLLIRSVCSKLLTVFFMIVVKS
jgi:hypothetical protein